MHNKLVEMVNNHLAEIESDNPGVSIKRLDVIREEDQSFIHHSGLYEHIRSLIDNGKSVSLSEALSSYRERIIPF